MSSSGQQNIIILEKNPDHRDYLKSVISRLGYIPFSFDKETICLDNLQSLNPHLVISGPLSLERSYRFINAVKMKNRILPVLIVSEKIEIQDFMETNGFHDVVVMKQPLKSFEINRAIRHLHRNSLKDKMFQDCPVIIGNSPEMVKIKRMISELSCSKETVLIQGETGTGKDLVARAIHYRSNRRNHPFVKVNAAAFSENIPEKEMFEYSTKTFEDTFQNEKGLFEIANSGTIFFDEIGRWHPSFQGKLLQVLDGDGIPKLCSEIKNTFDVRIIAGTSSDLNARVETGEFRKDLFYRLKVISIEIPPLRNRIQDILLLAAFFNDRFCGELDRSHYNISRKIKKILRRYSWPGNVRELKDLVKASVSLGDEENLVNKLGLHSRKNESSKNLNGSKDFYVFPELPDIRKYLKDLNKISLKDIRREFTMRTEKKMMKQALERTSWNRKKAATLLDISYKSLLNKIKAYNLA
jgi:DNA-binding NtrC family response regulator